MADQIDKLIKDVAVKHGVSIGRDAPILILQTINTQLIEESTINHAQKVQRGTRRVNSMLE